MLWAFALAQSQFPLFLLVSTGRTIYTNFTSCRRLPTPSYSKCQSGSSGLKVSLTALTTLVFQVTVLSIVQVGAQWALNHHSRGLRF